jgi:hypothetical protein
VKLLLSVKVVRRHVPMAVVARSTRLLYDASSVSGRARCRSRDVVLSQGLLVVAAVLDRLILAGVHGVSPSVGSTCRLVIGCLASSLVLQFVLLIARGLLERLPLLVVDLAVAVARHDRTLLTKMGILVRGSLGLIGGALSGSLILLEVVDLLVLGVGCANRLLPVSNAVLEQDVCCLGSV